MTAPAPFTPAALTFLRGLARHNTKPWFEAHKGEYERDVKAPLRALVEEMDVRFQRFAPEMTGDPKRSIFRIYRDIRFSKDKSPYKTHAACWFRHRNAGHRVGQEAEEGSAGLYFHIQPRGSFIGAGIWMPPRPVLNRLRDAIAEHPRSFAKVARGLSDEAMLKRMPRGFADDHPAARWLRYQSFTLGRELTDAQVIGPGLPRLLEREYQQMMPLVRWLNRALGL